MIESVLKPATFWCLTLLFHANQFLPSSCESSFCPMTSPLGDFVYVTDIPSYNVFGVTKAACASQCAFYTTLHGTSAQCRCFNYDVNAANCSLFAFEPKTFTSDPNGYITAYQIPQSPLTGLFTTVSSRQCSAPYEHNSQIYYGCRFNNQPTCSIRDQFGCILSNGTPANCIAEPDGNVNLALNHLAFQQNTYSIYAASLANDGRLDTASCTLNNLYNPWWAVDLVQSYLIRTVGVVNDDNTGYAFRLNNFFIKVSNVQPTVGQTLNVSTLTLCAQYSGSVGPSDTAIVFCPPDLQPFRYVIVQGSLPNQNAICLTEVTVYGSLGPPHPIVRSSSCSYPYTYEGVLYYRCMQNVSSATTASYQFACLTANRILATCYASAGYVAQITKYLVKTPGQDDVLTPSVSQWIAFLWRKANSSDGNWDLLWNDYVNGFGFQATYLWLGLERIHQLTTSGNWSLRLEYYYGGKWVSAEYDQFTVSDSNTYYTINYNGYVGDDLDRMSASGQQQSWSYNGMKFSTKDKDNDGFSGYSCNPSFSKGGWWFNSCGVLLLTDTNPRVSLDVHGTVWSAISEIHCWMKLH